MSASDSVIESVKKWGAHNYDRIPVVIERGAGVWVWDMEGNKYMDFLSAYSALNQGHNHPKIVEALTKQASELYLTSCAFYSTRLGEFVEYLARLCKKEAVLPMNTGAEAVESAIKIARKWGYQEKGIPQGKAEIVVFGNNFHGRTTTIVGFSSQGQYREGFGPFTPGFKLVEYGDLDAVTSAVTENTVAILVEPIQGEGGIIVPPEGYLTALRGLCTKENVLFMADEIQTGLGRTGRMFACDHEGVVPDIYILGKALGGGAYPVSAVVANRKIMDVLGPGDHGSTFGGNPLGSAAALAALKALKEEGMARNARAIGDRLKKELASLKSPHIKEIRGKGLMLGIELKEDAGPARDFCLKLKENGILCNNTHGNVVRFAPPLITTHNNIDWAMERIAKVF
ncbi:MAG: ornithine--oxo-acid transaminase [Candidatus Spechtbacterales bacterium]